MFESLSFCCSCGRSFAVLMSGSMSRGYLVILVVTKRMHSGMPFFFSSGLWAQLRTNCVNLRSLFIRSLYRLTDSLCWGAIHQLLNIILKLRILVSLPVSTLPYVVKVKNCS
jgi:hypothetical protein